MEDAMWWLQHLMLHHGQFNFGPIICAMGDLRDAMPSPFPPALANADMGMLHLVVEEYLSPFRHTIRDRLAATIMHIMSMMLLSAAPHALPPAITAELSAQLRRTSDGALTEMRRSLNRHNTLRIRELPTWMMFVRLGVAHFILPSAHRHGLFRSGGYEDDDPAHFSVAVGALSAASLSVFVARHPDRVPVADVHPWIRERMRERALALTRRCTEDPAVVSRLFARFESSGSSPVGEERDAAVLVAGAVRHRFDECPICMEEGVELRRLDCCGGDADAVLAGAPLHVMCAQCWRDLPTDPKRCPMCDRACSLAAATV